MSLNIYGIKVKKQLIELGINQKEFSKIAGVPEEYLSKILNGHKKGWKYRDKIEYALKNTKSKRLEW